MARRKIDVERIDLVPWAGQDVESFAKEDAIDELSQLAETKREEGGNG